ncbi:tRNA-dihydrouridine(20a/20b) synthase [NAD(P)+]-like [Mizuhopecten yessoensis]|uniref:tRNA-dihydrouridine synthase n=1 Tax=Mizuhopecten yessoensis TaxID=6573 RepID=A0A210PZN7_MIZYE|nr:tRNA-dihydrouridine(20a/20b) synthase [NAD(P)+]-like [Mizuhopecten yessoensis]OWF41947.1 tRNA-dihydrouridine(20a/20b) synthase [NAD(P)+]-like [Mizuhopecten yessoensis]
MTSGDGCHVWRKPLELFEDQERNVKICAPMVRYSKLPFRMLVRKYGCDLAFTPMILSDCFVKSVKARDSEFTTCKEDRPLVVQFAASNAQDLADAAEIIAPYADGVDLNCGCPQRWAIQEGYGACLITKPELVKDMVSQTRSRVSRSDFSVSVKIRLRENDKETVELCQRAEKAGASWITVHGRTPSQRAQPVNFDAIKLIKENVSIPVVANGDIKSLEDCRMVRERTGVNGVMAARGMLENPAMFAGYDTTPVACVKDWLELAISVGTTYQCFHNHLIYMMEKALPRSERRIFNALCSTTAVLDYLSHNYDINI